MSHLPPSVMEVWKKTTYPRNIWRGRTEGLAGRINWQTPKYIPYNIRIRSLILTLHGFVA